MTDLWEQKVTIYNDIPADAVNPRRFDRFVIEKCHIVKGIVPRADGTVQNLINAKTVETKDVDRYKSPFEYRKTPIDLAGDFYTVQIGDFVIEGEIDDVVTTSREFAELQQKYNEIGFVVRTVMDNIYGMSVDNIIMANVG